ncbi:M56 family metallopeptidase [Rhodococcus pyridinivorans]|uniref:M56 family metallopeptidase n=1 Tax=Rhodococcus pyridinivorans TaxID=103816 RepID=UPI001906A6E2|nr:M56 family metallopeptidase [Rhodococcus pyridinivorans]QQM55656.1 M56 family metallopeptidase [Rhodococcus pyridinivorans]
MIPVVCLLLYAIAVAVVGPLILARLTAAGIAPRLGVAAWLSAMAGVFVAAAAAVAIALVALGRSGDAARGIVDCFGVLSTSVGEYSGAGMRLLFGTMLSAGTVVGAIGTWRICRGVRRRRARAHEHARLARMIGRRIPDLDAVVIDSDEPVAYCIAGRERSVVITRGTLSVLAPRQLAAVLAHERAHLDGRHSLVLDIVHSAAAALPGVPLFRVGATEIGHLLEMCADDVAVRGQGRRALLGGLLALGGHPVQEGTLGAGGEVTARATRLVSPPPPLVRLGVTALLEAAIVTVFAVPLICTLMD